MLYDPARLKRQVEDAKLQVSNLPEDEREKRLQEIIEAQWQRIEDCCAAFRGPEVAAEGGRFDTLSLACWIAVAESANVPTVPIRYVGELDHTGLTAGKIDPVLPELSDLDVPGVARPDGHYCFALTGTRFCGCALGNVIPEPA